MVRRSGRSPAAALFDVDGTLVDTNYLNAVTWWEAFSQAGHYVPMAQVHRAIGMGSDQMLDKLLPPGRNKDADADIRTALKDLFEAHAMVVEPSSAITLASVKAGAGQLVEPICVILTGENIAREDHRRLISAAPNV